MVFPVRTMIPSRIRTVIVEDEPPARERLVRLLETEPDVSVVATCGDGHEAVDAITQHEPDLVFLDVQLPELDGFEVLASLPPHRCFELVVVTAHAGHALAAFDAAAIDYLLKPFDADRLHETLERVRSRLVGRNGPTPASGVALDDSDRPPCWDRVAVREHNRVLFVKPADIDWVQADGNYVRLHAGAQSHLVRETMRAVEQRLAPRGFLRINRSVLVNLDRVRELQPLFHGDAVVILHDGRRLNVTRAFRPQFDELLSTAR
jgi:two-component system LytT family response regulator